jgi:5'-deoxynucleotidase YfbR-like HD superfamily hydrolase
MPAYVLEPLGVLRVLTQHKPVDLENPDFDQWTIVELVTAICSALNNIVRWTGQARIPYTVGQHSTWVAARAIALATDQLGARLSSPEYTDFMQRVRVCAMLHDASEAFLGDVVAPLKKLLPDYRKLEARMQTAILRRLIVGMPSGRWSIWPIVAQADADAAITEATYFGLRTPFADAEFNIDWGAGKVIPLDYPLEKVPKLDVVNILDLIRLITAEPPEVAVTLPGKLAADIAEWHAAKDDSRKPASWRANKSMPTTIQDLTHANNLLTAIHDQMKGKKP